MGTSCLACVGSTASWLTPVARRTPASCAFTPRLSVRCLSHVLQFERMKAEAEAAAAKAEAEAKLASLPKRAKVRALPSRALSWAPGPCRADCRAPLMIAPCESMQHTLSTHMSPMCMHITPLRVHHAGRRGGHLPWRHHQVLLRLGRLHRGEPDPLRAAREDLC